jgi:very-short-patch-repair endonuclease
MPIAMTENYRGGLSRTELLAWCRDLRRRETDAERLLWMLLRGRQIAGAKFRRQHQFGPFILDFFCAEHRLAIEVDGGQHFSDEGKARDGARTTWLGRESVRMLRFDNLQVLRETEAVVETILEALSANTIPSPQPSPRGRGSRLPSRPADQGRVSKGDHHA